MRWTELHEEDHVPASIRLHLRDVTLATALDAVLAQVPATSRLTWTVEGGIIHVTDDVYLRDAETVRFYGIGDLGGPREVVRLQELLTQRVQPDSWRENGGAGALYRFDGVLAIVQTERAHLEIAKLLDALRRARSGNTVAPRN